GRGPTTRTTRGTSPTAAIVRSIADRASTGAEGSATIATRPRAAAGRPRRSRRSASRRAGGDVRPDRAGRLVAPSQRHTTARPAPPPAPPPPRRRRRNVALGRGGQHPDRGRHRPLRHAADGCRRVRREEEVAEAVRHETAHAGRVATARRTEARRADATGSGP